MVTTPSVRRERRHSQRWECDKPLAWRVRGGRRTRLGVIPQRSLGGFVVSAVNRDASPAGTFLQPGDESAGIQHGFRVAVVRRTAPQPNGRCLLFVEILA